MRFEGLLQELLADTDAGNGEISSDAAFMEMQVALEGKAGSQMGDAVIAAQPPNFKKATELCTELLGQSKHLELMIALARAASGQHGFSGLADSLQVVVECCKNKWPDIYPLEDKDDPDDPWWERINIFRELTDNPAIVDQLDVLALVSVRHLGEFSKRDMDIASGRRDASEEDKERCNPNIIRGAFSESSADELTATDQALADVISRCTALDEVLGGNIGADAPSFDKLRAKIEEYRTIFREYAGSKLTAPEPEPVVEVQAEQADGAEAPAAANGAAGVPATTQVTQTVVSVAFPDRDSVAAAFDDVIRFYQKHEPSSPVPILLFRARQMVYKNFFDILRELAPQHKDNLRSIMGALRDDPLTFLLEHSYNSFLNGESYEVAAAPATTESAEPHGGDTYNTAEQAAPAEPASEGVTSRAQVLQTLKDIQQFFEVQEPSSPVPLIVQRVITLVPKTFMDLLAEFEFAAEAAEAKGGADMSAASASGTESTESSGSDGGW